MRKISNIIKTEEEFRGNKFVGVYEYNNEHYTKGGTISKLLNIFKEKGLILECGSSGLGDGFLFTKDLGYDSLDGDFLIHVKVETRLSTIYFKYNNYCKKEKLIVEALMEFYLQK